LLDKKPYWVKKKVKLDAKTINEVRTLIEDLSLNTVCQSAQCPNIFECFANKTATFMLMGDICTRNCSYCSVKTGKPEALDEEEPLRVAEAVEKMGLKYVVITSVTRDDIPDGGAAHFSNTIRQIKKLNPDSGIECLIPDFRGDNRSLEVVLDQKLNVLNHNIETVERIFNKVRRGSDYRRSLRVLKSAKEIKPDIYTKSGFMLGLGEEKREIVELLKDLRNVDCDILTIGQYLQPSGLNIKVSKYYTQQEFKKIGKIAEEMGFKAVVSGIFVRSSYNAGIVLENVLNNEGRKDSNLQAVTPSTL
jgi:lipoyl synthase